MSKTRHPTELKTGMRVELAVHWLSDHLTGIVTRIGLPGHPELIRVKRDGVMGVETWHRDFWEPVK